MELVMNTYTIIEMLAFYSRFERMQKPEWRSAYAKHLKRVRLCHSEVDGGIKKSYYSIETKSNEIVDLVYNEEELIWTLEPSVLFPVHTVDRVLALIKRNKHMPSRSHRVIPYRFEIVPKNEIRKTTNSIELPHTFKVQPYRFRSYKIKSSQVIDRITIIEKLLGNHTFGLGGYGLFFNRASWIISLSSLSAMICLSIRFSLSSYAFCLLSWSPPRFSRADSPKLSNFCFHLYKLLRNIKMTGSFGNPLGIGHMNGR